jgi:ubiquinone/menaquinone biosynthesis C-methylase UbiE
MNSVKSNKDTFYNYYNKPDWWFSLRYDTQYKKKTCIELIKRNKIIVDDKKIFELGFGSGDILLSFGNSDLHGLEMSNSAITFVNNKAKKKKIANIKLGNKSNGLLPYSNNYFDIIIASHIMEHVKNDAITISEINRILVNGGYCIILIPINENYDDPNHVRKYTSNSFIHLATSNKFSVIENFENEYLFHLVEDLYLDKSKKHGKIYSTLIALLFNLPFALLPLFILKYIEYFLKKFQYNPRQAVLLLKKQ